MITGRGRMPLEAYWNDGNYFRNSWWRHQMEKFSALLAICTGNSPMTGEFPAQRPVTRSFDVFFYPLLNKRWSKQWWGWWFETPSRPLWRHFDEYCKSNSYVTQWPFLSMTSKMRANAGKCNICNAVYWANCFPNRKYISRETHLRCYPGAQGTSRCQL